MQEFFQAPHAGLSRIALNNLLDRCVRDVELLFQQPSPLQQSGKQEVLGDGQFLFRDIAGQTNDIHAVQQRPRNRVQLVRGADEQNL